MRIVLKKSAAQAIGFNNVANQMLIRSCFYLGYNVNFIAGIVGSPLRDKEAIDIIETAQQLGMNENDKVLVHEDDPTSGRQQLCDRRDHDRSVARVSAFAPFR